MHPSHKQLRHAPCLPPCNCAIKEHKHTWYVQGGSFAYLVPTAAITALVKSRQLWDDAPDGTNHERFLASPQEP